MAEYPMVSYETWKSLHARGWRGSIRRWLWRFSGLPQPTLPPMSGGDGAGWTPIRHTAGTTSDLAAHADAKLFAGVIITTNGTASLSILKTGLTAGSGTEVMRFQIPAATGGETRSFPMPGFLVLQGGMNLDIDANVTNFTIFHS